MILNVFTCLSARLRQIGPGRRPGDIWRSLRAFPFIFFSLHSMAEIDASAQGQVVRVGLYENEPKVFTNTAGVPAGIFIDLLNEIAVTQNWTLDYRPCDWSQCLNWLETGQLDLMPDVALTDDRQRRFDFHQQPALNSWSQLYSRPDQPIVSIFQLNDARVALLQDSVQLPYFQSMLINFGLQTELIEAPDYPEAFRRVRDGEADAAVSNYLYGALHASQYNLVATPIAFQPSQLYFATGKGQKSDLLAAIDQQLTNWRANSDSVYFDILNEWQNLPPKPLIPRWLILSLTTALALLAITVLLITWLRHLVAARTRALSDSERKLTTILDSVGAFIYIKNRDFKYQYANQQLLDFLGKRKEEILDRTDSDLFGETVATPYLSNDRQVFAQGHPVRAEETLKGNDEERTFLSIKIPLHDHLGSIYALCGISTDITEEKDREARIQYLAYYEPLTGLPNRAYLFDYLAPAILNRPPHQGLALMVLDLDDFKDINDTHGHDYGDQLLIEVVRRLTNALPDKGHLIHLGADEFVIVMFTEGTPNDPASAFCEQVTQYMRNGYEWRDFSNHCTASIGLALLEPAEAGDLGQTLKHAEVAMHQAKLNGRDGWCLFTEQMHIALQTRLALDADMRNSLADQDFFLVYQLQFDDRQQAIGAEALLRWRHPQRGLVSPMEFIPLAERNGLILPLGRWVLLTACQQLVHWAGQTETSGLSMSVNVSAVQFRSADFTAIVAEVLAQTGARAERLKLELTETMLIDDLDDAIRNISELKAMGVDVALDDFGTGYSSLAYLKRLPLSQLKIDQTFVADVLIDPVAAAIARTIIGLGHSLDLNVIAEGVETEEQREWLKQEGCLAYQGYLFGRPETAEQLRHRWAQPAN